MEVTHTLSYWFNNYNDKSSIEPERTAMVRSLTVLQKMFHTHLYRLSVYKTKTITTTLHIIPFDILLSNLVWSELDFVIMKSTKRNTFNSQQHHICFI